MSTPDIEVDNYITSESDENADVVNTESSKLSGGSIAIIVIVCLVVVATAAFCVYWFIFRNKSDEATNEVTEDLPEEVKEGETQLA